MLQDRSDCVVADVETDVVIVGAGLAGLLLARRLQRGGRRATVVEKNAAAGGYNGDVVIEGRPYPLVNYKSLGLGGLEELFAGEPAGTWEAPVRLPHADHVFLPDMEVRLPASAPAFEECLAGLFPGERGALRRFMETLGELYDLMNGWEKGGGGLGQSRLIVAMAKYDRMPYEALLLDSFTDPRLRAVLSARVFSSENSVLTMAGYLGKIFFDGLYYVPGAGRELTRRLLGVLGQPGSTVRLLLGRPVAQILFDPALRASGVRLSDGTVLRAGHVVLNADAAHVAADLIAEPTVREALQGSMAGVAAGLSALTVIVRLRPAFQERLQAFAGVARILYSDTYDLVGLARNREHSRPDRSAFKLNFDWPTDPAEEVLLHVEYDCGFDDPEQADPLRLRGDLLRRLQPCLDRIFGDCAHLVDGAVVVTPRDLARITNNARGSGSGWRDGQRPRQLERHLTRHGLLQIGQWSRFGSGVHQLDRSAATAYESICAGPPARRGPSLGVSA